MRRLSLLSLTILTIIASPASAQFFFWGGGGGNNFNRSIGALYALQEYQRARQIVSQQQWYQQQYAMQRQMNMYQPRYGAYGYGTYGGYAGYNGYSAPVGNGMYPGEGYDGYPASYSPQPAPVVDKLANDRMLCWDIFGATFVAANASDVKAVDSRFQGGMAVAAIRTGGPADIAGWQNGDILVGLYKFRTMTYDNLSYVAELPDLGTLSPIRTVIIRGDKVIEGKLDILKGLPSQGSNSVDSASPSASQWTEPASAKATVPPELSAAPPKSGSEADEKLLWDRVGIHGHGTLINRPGIQFKEGVTISAIKPDSPAQQASWHVGEQIVGLAGYQIRSVDDMAYVLNNIGLARSIEYMTVSGGGVGKGTVAVSAVPAPAATAKGAEVSNPIEEPLPAEPSVDSSKKK